MTVSFSVRVHAVCSSEAEPEVLVRPGLAQLWPDVRPVLSGRELLPPERQEDNSHAPAAGGRAARL